MPPAKPPKTLGFGSYCFKATCEVYKDEDGRGIPDNACPIAKVTGYDTHVGVGKDTEFVCRQHARTTLQGEHRCGPAQVVMLMSNPPGLECSGQMFFELAHGERTRIV